MVLDTNALLALLTKPNLLGSQTTKLISDKETLHYSSISVFEIVIKDMLGKLKLPRPLMELLDSAAVASKAFEFQEAVAAYAFPSLTGHDPFDRMILATAKAHGAKLITSDRKMLELGFDWVWDSSK